MALEQLSNRRLDLANNSGAGEPKVDGGEESMCCSLKDKYGLSWQIVPSARGELIGDPDPVKAKRVTNAMLKMKKIIVEDL